MSKACLHSNAIFYCFYDIRKYSSLAKYCLLELSFPTDHSFLNIKPSATISA